MAVLLLLLLLLPVEMGSCGRGEGIRKLVNIAEERDMLELIVGEMWCHCVCDAAFLMKP